MRILIIRHGDPDYALDSLTEKGWKEAELLSERLKKIEIDDIYCSPLGRAKDTAKATLEKIGKKAEVLPWLEEFRGRITMNKDEGEMCPWNIHPKFWQHDEKLYDRNLWAEADLLSGNTDDVFKETKRGIDELLEKYGFKKDGIQYKCDNNPQKTIALFCHQAIGCAIIGYLTGVSPFLLWHTYFIPTTSVTTLVTSEEVKGEVLFRCMQMGDTSHLYAADEEVSKSGLLTEIYDLK